MALRSLQQRSSLGARRDSGRRTRVAVVARAASSSSAASVPRSIGARPAPGSPSSTSYMLPRLILLSGLAALAAAGGGGAVVELTDENFDKETSQGVWMVKVYAPWCSHCRQLEPLWQVFAEEAHADGVRVGKIDGTSERAMMSRLRITAFPSIFLFRDGRTYVYQGARNVASFRAFATSAYKSEKALPFYKAPNSLVGRLIGRLHSLPRIGVRVYRVLHDTHKLSDTAIVLGFLAIPVAVGGVLICALDALYVRKAREEFGPEHDHQE